MRAVTLCSGSKGNATFIEINNIKILIDAGKTYKYICEKLDSIGINITDIDYVFITHNHSDHVASLKSVINYSKAKLCTTKNLYESLKEKIVEEEVIFFEDEITLNDVVIKALKSSHDAPDSRNYVIKHNNKKLTLITDTGYVKQKHFKTMANSDIILMESNHDIDLLQNGSYPQYLKARILSDDGHLSNNQAGFYLSKIIGINTQKVILIHLSEENNSPEAALNTVRSILKDYQIKFDDIDYARQFELSEVMKID